jgi:membrane-bound acyltransferase YfiQ involved in biofilm formation
MSDEKPVIDLEPRNPFSWRVAVAFLGAWLVAFALVWWLKSNLLRLLLPVIALLFVLYLGVCTLLLLKNRNRR